jgi:hypothetical protein
MPSLSVTSAFFHQEKILLMKREDLQSGRFPGREVDPVESIVEAALRDESGLARAEFHHQHFGDWYLTGEILEAGGDAGES